MAFDIMVPDVVFRTRKEIDTEPGFIWYDLTSQEVFAGKRVAKVTDVVKEGDEDE